MPYTQLLPYLLELVLLFFGTVSFSVFLFYLFKCAFINNPYRIFCSYWFLDIFSWYNYTNPINHAYQRWKYGCSNHDAWSFDMYLLDMLPVGLKHVRDSDMCDISSKDWTAMIRGIEEYKHIYDCLEQDCPVSHTQLRKDFEESMSLITKHFITLWI